MNKELPDWETRETPAITSQQPATTLSKPSFDYVMWQVNKGGDYQNKRLGSPRDNNCLPRDYVSVQRRKKAETVEITELVPVAIVGERGLAGRMCGWLADTLAG